MRVACRLDRTRLSKSGEAVGNFHSPIPVCIPPPFRRNHYFINPTLQEVQCLLTHLSLSNSISMSWRSANESLMKSLAQPEWPYLEFDFKTDIPRIIGIQIAICSNNYFSNVLQRFFRIWSQLDDLLVYHFSPWNTAEPKYFWEWQALSYFYNMNPSSSMLNSPNQRKINATFCHLIGGFKLW